MRSASSTRYRSLPSGSSDHNFVARPDVTAADSPRIAAKIEMRTVDPLHGHAEGFGNAILVDIDLFELSQEMRSLVPRRSLLPGPKNNRSPALAELLSTGGF